MTLKRAYIQLNDSFFASGQAYVALSRVKTIENLHLLEYDRSAIYLEDYYRSLINWMTSVNIIRDKDGPETPECPYPKRVIDENDKKPEKKSRKRKHRETNDNDVKPKTKASKPNNTKQKNVDKRQQQRQQQQQLVILPQVDNLYAQLNVDLHDRKESFLSKSAYHTDFLFKMVIKSDQQRYEDLHENRQAPQQLSTS